MFKQAWMNGFVSSHQGATDGGRGGGKAVHDVRHKAQHTGDEYGRQTASPIPLDVRTVGNGASRWGSITGVAAGPGLLAC